MAAFISRRFGPGPTQVVLLRSAGVQPADAGAALKDYMIIQELAVRTKYKAFSRISIPHVQ